MTIYDIAQKAGVSITTVSRVLNGKGKVSPETRRHVQEVLEASNYIPNQVAQGLASRASKTVGVITIDIRDIHHAAIAYMIEQSMSLAGYSTIMCNLGGSQKNLEQYITMLVSRQISGIFFIGSVFANAECESLIVKHLSNIPVLIANGILPAPNVYGVLADEYHGFFEAAELLVRKGRKRIALISSSRTPSEILKCSGYSDVMKRYQLEDIELMCERSIAGGKSGTEQLLRLRPDIDAIQYTEDLTATGGVHALHELGIDVPGQVAVIGCNSSVYCSLCYPTLTSIDNRLCDTGQSAAHMMLQLMAGKTDVPKTLSLTCRVIERSSTDISHPPSLY